MTNAQTEARAIAREICNRTGTLIGQDSIDFIATALSARDAAKDAELVAVKAENIERVVQKVDAGMASRIDALCSDVARLRAILSELVDRDVSYHGGEIRIPTASHAHAIALIRRAREAQGGE